MTCPHCTSTTTTELTKRTQLGYRTFRCSACRRPFNERTGTPFNYLEFPTDSVLLVVLWRVRYALSRRDVAEMCLERGFEVPHAAAREWEARFAPRLADNLRAKRKGKLLSNAGIRELRRRSPLLSCLRCTAFIFPPAHNHAPTCSIVIGATMGVRCSISDVDARGDGCIA